MASDGEEALRTLEQGARPALVVLDLMMPRVTARVGLPAGCRVLHKPLEREVLLSEARALT